MKKPFVIRCESSSEIPGSMRTKDSYLLRINNRKMTRTRWIDNARGFESREEAHAFIEQIAFQLPRLNLSVANRNEIKSLQTMSRILEAREIVATEFNRIIELEVK